MDLVVEGAGVRADMFTVLFAAFRARLRLRQKEGMEVMVGIRHREPFQNLEAVVPVGMVA
jgi:hypothetical protein